MNPIASDTIIENVSDIKIGNNKILHRVTIADE
jgi:hypothetical protein